jgi:hypothetical protein
MVTIHPGVSTSFPSRFGRNSIVVDAHRYVGSVGDYDIKHRTAAPPRNRGEESFSQRLTEWQVRYPDVRVRRVVVPVGRLVTS